MTEIFVELGERSYSIEIERDLVKTALEREAYIVTDYNVANAYSQLLKDKPNVVIIKPGELSKSLKLYGSLAKKLKDAEKIIAFGGGVVGDLTGFVASTLKRGIPLMQVPTTLLSMVDASIGGKNGINLDGRKNYLGTIYQPNGIYVDPNLLKTLPKTEITNGVAEIIKYGAIKDSFLLERMQNEFSIEDKDLEGLIAKCVNIKKYFVELDERDENIRHALNFGHTIGHAVELEYDLSHGQAISIGMVYESLLTFDRNKTRKIITALKANNLPITLPKNTKVNRVIRRIKADKKGEFIFAFDENHYNVKINEDILREVLSS